MASFAHRFDKDYVAPTARWSRVLGQELIDLTDKDTKRIGAAQQAALPQKAQPTSTTSPGRAQPMKTENEPEKETTRLWKRLFSR